ncbi:MAG: 50S ribosomal protein L24 [Coxiella sp. DG_40]|nr:MAG: 50S ribosomal protein L24 [Coxiella sp. DG_40]
MACRIKKGDKVTVLTGKSKGVSGKVLRVLKDSNKVIIEGVNLIKKHEKPNPQAQKPGGVVEKEAPIHISNVALALPLQKGKDTKKYSKVGFKTLEDGRKVRYFKYNDELVEV